MIARYVQEGLAIDYRPEKAVAAGDVVVQENLVGIAKLDIPANELGALALTGVFEAPKVTGEIKAGAVVYWKAAESKVTTEAESNKYLGKAIRKAESSDETVYFLLNAPYVEDKQASEAA